VVGQDYLETSAVLRALYGVTRNHIWRRDTILLRRLHDALSDPSLFETASHRGAHARARLKALLEEQEDVANE